jgi:hypothetical protein
MTVKTCCRIKSVEIAFRSQFVNGITKELRGYFKTNKIGRYRRYAQTCLIEYEAKFFSKFESIGNEILCLLGDLKRCGILQFNFNKDVIRLYKLTLQFKLPYPELIFCDMRGFRKINKNSFASLDYKKKPSPKKRKGGLKRCSVFFFISRKYLGCCLCKLLFF